MKKLLAMFVALALLLPLCGLTALATDTAEPPTKLKFFRVAVEQDPTQDRLLLELQKRTNTEIEFITAPWDAEGLRVMTILSSQEPMDVMAINTLVYDFASFCRDGLILQLDEYLATDKYPILKKLAYGDVYYKRYNIDGNIYGIPCPQQPGDWNNYIRSDWLENVGLDMPTTPEEMYEVLKAFKEKDPDQNGVDDTQGIYVAQANGQLQPIFAMFMASYGTSFYEMSEGELSWIYASPMYKESLEYINRLYREELINQDLFTIQDKNYVRYQFSAGVSGWVTSPMISGDHAELLKVDADAEVALLSPLPHKNNSIGAYAGDSNWNWMSNVLPATCENPEKALELLEYLHSDEGRKLMCVGIEGIHYERYETEGEVGIFYGVSAEEQSKDWDPAKGEGPTGSPMWWGMASTINGTLPLDEYDSLEEALKHATMFVTKEDYDTNPYWDMRKRGSEVTNHDYVPVSVPGWLDVSANISAVKDEYEARIIMAEPEDIEALWAEYLAAIDGLGYAQGMEAIQAWYDENK